MADSNLQHTNPFYQSSTLPYQAPPFDRIEEKDFSPAIDEGIRQYLADIDEIANQTQPATVENTYIAMEQAGPLLKRVMQVFGAMTSANTTDGLQKIDEIQSPKLAAMQDAINLNSKLFARLETVWQQRHDLSLSNETLRLVEVHYQAFVAAGARLSAEDKQTLSALNQEAASLTTRFSQRLLAAATQGALLVKEQEAVAGLSAAQLSAAQQAAAQRNAGQAWLLVLQNTTQQPLLQNLSNRPTRQALYQASVSRAERGDDNDTRQIITRLAAIRAQQAQLLGYANYASWSLEDQMAKTPDAALTFMRDIVPAASARAKREAADIQTLMDRLQPGETLEAWDWLYYADKVRQEKYDLNDAEVKPYFELENVLHNGVFYAATQLYGVTFKARNDIPVYHEDVQVYEVFDEQQSPLALFYTDFYQRDSKSGGAWMGNFVDQSLLLGSKPVIYNVANFAKPAEGHPALLSWDDVITMFHEFGHALHGMFADQQYPSLSGTATPRDFVEFPSQFNEHWASEPRIFAHYARHHQTGEPMPAALLAKIEKASRFNKGYEMSELLAAALLDMHWHQLASATPPQDVAQFETTALTQEQLLLSYVPPRYRSSYFQHIWGGGYAAGYYAYLWTQMLADDAYAGFVEQGGLTPENGRRFREQVLSRGNSEALEQLYRDWRGHDPQIEPMLENRGLTDDR